MAQQDGSPAKASGENIEQFGYKQELRRGMGLWDVVLYGVLFMVIIAPQSIFGTIQQNSHGMTPLVYIIGFVAILFTAMSYMRMSKRFPIAGSVYSYVQRGINPHVGFMAGWLILLDYVLVPSLLIVMVMNWGVALVPGSPAWLWAVAFIAFNTFVNIRGIQMSRGVDWVIFIVEIVAVVAFIALGTNFVLGGGGAGGFVLDPIYQPGQVDAHFVAAGISIAALSFLGFDGMSTLAEETHEPEKNIGGGIIITVHHHRRVRGADLHRRHRAARLGGHRSRHGLLRFRLPSGRAAVLQDHVAGQHRRGGHRQHHQRADGILAPAVQHGPRRRDPARVRQGASEVPDAVVRLHLLGRDHAVPGASAAGTMGTLAGFVNFGALSSFILLNFAAFVLLREGKKRASFKDILMYLICPFIGIAILGYVFTGFEWATYAVGVTWLVIGLIIGAGEIGVTREVRGVQNLEINQDIR